MTSRPKLARAPSPHPGDLLRQYAVTSARTRPSRTAFLRYSWRGRRAAESHPRANHTGARLGSGADRTEVLCAFFTGAWLVALAAQRGREQRPLPVRQASGLHGGARRRRHERRRPRIVAFNLYRAARHCGARPPYDRRRPAAPAGAARLRGVCRTCALPSCAGNLVARVMP
jgi:hypothetical protein